MIEVMRDFEVRSNEIELYFKFLEQIINDKAVLFFPQKMRNNKKQIDLELQKVLKAHGFLILYNLIESSIKKSIAQIYEKVTSENVFYKDLKDEIKIIWIEINLSQKGYNEILPIIDRIAEDVINITFDGKKVISGNIDARKIREFASVYGFSSKTHPQSRNGAELVNVKSKRNDLAHGVISFAECGKDHTLEDLIKTKKEVIIYLKGILKNVNSYIRKKGYLKPVS